MASLPSPPPAPQRGDRATFSGRVDAFLTWLVALIPQLNAFMSELGTLAVGGANTFAYVLDGSTSDSDPGQGKMRIGAATQKDASKIILDINPSSGADVTNFFTVLKSGTSNIKGSIRLLNLADVKSYLLYDITAVDIFAGYISLTTTPRASTTANPFGPNDTIIVFVDPKGDRGDGGNTPTAQQMRDAIGTLPVSNGGTGATTTAVARANLDVLSSAEVIRRDFPNVSSGTRLLSGATPAIASMNGSNGNEDFCPLIIGNNGNQGASAVIQFLRGGQFAAFLGLDTDNRFKVGGISMGGVSYELFHRGNLNPNEYAKLSGAIFSGAISAPTITETSDERLKHNWHRLTDNQLDALAELEKVGVFDWLDGSGSAVGGSAQAIREIVPEAVREDADGKLSVAYGGLAFAMAQGALRRASRA